MQKTWPTFEVIIAAVGAFIAPDQQDCGRGRILDARRRFELAHGYRVVAIELA